MKVAVVLPCVGINRDLPLVVACFLRQTWPDREMHVVNVQGDIRFDHPLVHVHNVAPERFPTIRHQISHGVEQSGCRYFCKWDSDDFYAPWFLEESMAQILARSGRHVKPETVWLLQGRPYRSLEPFRGTLEGSWLLDRELIDTLLDAESELDYLDSAFFRDALRDKLIHAYPQGEVNSYCYTWDSASEHFSGYYQRPGSLEERCRRYREHAARHHATGDLPPIDWGGTIDALAALMPEAVRDAFLGRVREAAFRSLRGRLQSA